MNDFQSMMNQIAAQQNNNNNRNFMNYAPHYEIIQVNGRAGAENFRMGPNSNYLLLDNSAAIIWLVKTDGSGLLTAIPYDYTPHQEPQPVDVSALAQRVQQLEEELNNVRQSNTRSNKQSNKKQQFNASESSTTNV